MAFFSFKPAEANAKGINIDRYIRDTNGAYHHVHGWIEVGFFSISHCDMWYDNTNFVMSTNPLLLEGTIDKDYINGAQPMDEDLLFSLLDGSYEESNYSEFQFFQL